jgi:Transcriptional regulatory protein, C terminal/WD40-like Beta Propeller Repeat
MLTGCTGRSSHDFKLQDQPFHLLAFLLQRPGVIVTREELRAALWPGDTFVDFDYGVNTAIKKVRWALGDSADNPRFIQTVPRKGYRFIAPVSPEESPAVTPAVPVAGFPKHRRAWFFAAGLAAVLAAGVWVLIPASTPGPVGVPVPLTAYPGAQYGAAFSPDGRQVAFAWNGVEEDNFDIYVKANGSDSLRRLTEDPAADLSPAWSPDGRWIAFLRDLSQGRVAIMMVPAAGGFAVMRPHACRVVPAPAAPQTRTFPSSACWSAPASPRRRAARRRSHRATVSASRIARPPPVPVVIGLPGVALGIGASLSLSPPFVRQETHGKPIHGRAQKPIIVSLHLSDDFDSSSARSNFVTRVSRSRSSASRAISKMPKAARTRLGAGVVGSAISFRRTEVAAPLFCWARA